MEKDTEFEVQVIRDVRKIDSGYELNFVSGYSFFCPEVGITPVAGMTAKLYSRGLAPSYRVHPINFNYRISPFSRVTIRSYRVSARNRFSDKL